jgi:hypothetical protein
MSWAKAVILTPSPNLVLLGDRRNLDRTTKLKLLAQCTINFISNGLLSVPAIEKNIIEWLIDRVISIDMGCLEHLLKCRIIASNLARTIFSLE